MCFCSWCQTVNQREVPMASTGLATLRNFCQYCSGPRSVRVKERFVIHLFCRSMIFFKCMTIWIMCSNPCALKKKLYIFLKSLFPCSHAYSFQDVPPPPACSFRLSLSLQAMYFEVGNLNTETYPASVDLPTYVRENYELNGNRGSYNLDRIIMSYQVRTKEVETVYVTEHDTSAPGRFCSDRTYEISLELIQALQSPLLDLPTFLTQMGYGPVQLFYYNAIEEYYPESPAQQMYSNFQNYSGSTTITEQNYHVSYEYDQRAYSTARVTTNSRGHVGTYSDVQPSYWRQSYWPYEPDQHYKGMDVTGDT